MFQSGSEDLERLSSCFLLGTLTKQCINEFELGFINFKILWVNLIAYGLSTQLSLMEFQEGA